MLFGLKLKPEQTMELSGFLAIGKIFEEYFQNGKKIKNKDPEYEDPESFANIFFTSMFEKAEKDNEKFQILKEISFLSLIHSYKIALNKKFRTMKVIELTEEYLQQTIEMKSIVGKYFSSERKPEEVISFVLPQVYDMNYLSLFESLLDINSEKWLLKGIFCVRDKIASCIVKKTANREWVLRQDFRRDEFIPFLSFSAVLRMAIENGYTPASFFYVHEHDSKIGIKENVTGITTCYLNMLAKKNKGKQAKTNHRSSFKDLVTEQLNEQKLNFINYIPTLYDREYQSTLISSLIPSVADRKSPSAERKELVMKIETNINSKKGAGPQLHLGKFASKKEEHNSKILEPTQNLFFSKASKPINKPPEQALESNSPIVPTPSKPVPTVGLPKTENENAIGLQHKQVNNLPIKELSTKGPQEVPLVRSPNTGVGIQKIIEGPDQPVKLVSPGIKSTNNQKPLIMNQSNKGIKIPIPEATGKDASKLIENDHFPKSTIESKVENKTPPALPVFDFKSNVENKTPTPLLVFESRSSLDNSKSPDLGIPPILPHLDQSKIMSPPSLGAPPELNSSNLNDPPPLQSLISTQNINQAPVLSKHPPPPSLLNHSNTSNFKDPPPLQSLINPPNIDHTPGLSKPSPPSLLHSKSPNNFFNPTYPPQISTIDSSLTKSNPNFGQLPDLGPAPILFDQSQQRKLDFNEKPNPNGGNFMSYSSSNPLINQSTPFVASPYLLESHQDPNSYIPQDSFAAGKAPFYNHITGAFEPSNIPQPVISGTEITDLANETSYSGVQNYDLDSSKSVFEHHNLETSTNWTCDHCQYSLKQDSRICPNCYKQFLCPYCSAKTEYYAPKCLTCDQNLYYEQPYN